MKKASIITLHFYDNFGSVLQAWALKRQIENTPGFAAEIIPFRPPIPNYVYFRDEELQKNFYKKQTLFADFRRDYLGLKTADGDERELGDINSDILITGSDIVWSREHSGLHPAYFLSFGRESARRVGYAISQHLQGKDEAMLAKYLTKFDALSVRENRDKKLLEKYACVPLETVLDPTLLMTAADYLPLEKKPTNAPPEPYLLFYSLTHDPAMVDAANVIAQKLQLKIVHYLADYPAQIFPPDSSCFAFVGPQEFLWLVKNAAFVFTNSYHGTIFSVLYQRPFFTQVTRGAMSSRPLELTTALGMEAQRYSSWRNLANINLNVDWEGVHKRLEPLRQKSKLFLQKALKD